MNGFIYKKNQERNMSFNNTLIWIFDHEYYLLYLKLKEKKKLNKESENGKKKNMRDMI